MKKPQTDNAPESRFHRTELLVGDGGMRLLAESHVAVFGIGGVGSYAAEALARAAVGRLTLVDYDRVVPSNMNRQLHATEATLGQWKVEAMAERIQSINPAARITARPVRFDHSSAEKLLDFDFDYVIDAMDIVRAKILLLTHCLTNTIPAVSSMGAANKLSPRNIVLSDIGESRYCPLARRVRKELRKHGVVTGINVVYADELPLVKPAPAEPRARQPNADELLPKRPQGTISYVPALFGLYCASAAIETLLHPGPQTE